MLFLGKSTRKCSLSDEEEQAILKGYFYFLPYQKNLPKGINIRNAHIRRDHKKKFPTFRSAESKKGSQKKISCERRVCESVDAKSLFCAVFQNLMTNIIREQMG